MPAMALEILDSEAMACRECCCLTDYEPLSGQKDLRPVWAICQDCWRRLVIVEPVSGKTKAGLHFGCRIAPGLPFRDPTIVYLYKER